MKPIRMLVFAAAALATTGLVNALPASATSSTQLCKVHEKGFLTCPGGQAAVELDAKLSPGKVASFLSPSFTVLCLFNLLNATTLGLGQPQSLHTSTLYFSNCGTTATHNDCTVDVGAAPLFNLLKIALDAGTLSSTNGYLYISCGFFKSCTYDLSNLVFGVSAQKVIANESTLERLFGGFLGCPSEMSFDAELETGAEVYVLQ